MALFWDFFHKNLCYNTNMKNYINKGGEKMSYKYDKIKNIYDLRNNLMEWTAEAGGYDFRVLIPNDYIEGTGVTAYSYWLERPDNPIENQGSRMILYL